MPSSVSAAELIARYEVILLDAYGVLVDSEGALPGGRALLAEIARQRRRFLVVTNDASRLPATAARRYQRFGLDVAEEQIITSGALLAPYFARRGLRGARCMVLGTADSVAYVEQAGGQVVPVSATGACDALLVCDDDGYPFLETLDAALSMLYRHLDREKDVELVLPNPDLIYPKGGGDHGFTSGAAAMLLEAGLARRYPGAGHAFACLGKPHRPMFDEARRRAGTESLVMIGDQLETDIAGAAAAGIESALVGWGISRWQPGSAITPTHLLTLP